MTIEILSIGGELLSGWTVNTNAATIGKHLKAHGYSVDRITVISDDPQKLKARMEEALSRSSFVIATGGLGPTGDDRTRDIAAELFGSGLVYKVELEEELIRRYGPRATHRHQATVPEKAEVILNHWGTAPGFIFNNGQSSLAVLPGVPNQMEEMLLSQVIPCLEKTLPKNHQEKALFFCMLYETQLDPFLRKLEKEHPEVEIGICPSYSHLSVFVRSNNLEVNLDLIAEKIKAEFPTQNYSDKSSLIELALHETLIQSKKTLALAESCTGGRMASRLTNISGASDYFLGSVVSYSNHLKQEVLAVSSEALDKHGAVSREVVTQMAQGVMKASGADYGIAVSGIAGPLGGTKEKPVGTVWGAIAEKGGKIYVGKFDAKGVPDRGRVIEYTSTYLFSSLWRLLKHQIPPFADDK